MTEHQKKIQEIERIAGVQLGQEVYLIENRYARKDTINMICITTRGFRVRLRSSNKFGKTYQLGKDVFLTKAEAEDTLLKRCFSDKSRGGGYLIEKKIMRAIVALIFWYNRRKQ